MFCKQFQFELIYYRSQTGIYYQYQKSGIIWQQQKISSLQIKACGKNSKGSKVSWKRLSFIFSLFIIKRFSISISLDDLLSKSLIFSQIEISSKSLNQVFSQILSYNGILYIQE
ncbi:hypothetical protein IMG5_096850 [Ichthyophthirius multifiliis]|uniref:Uncharacterized protein n=1 Tax=Ichthyophthirius multifiliis TaxID=5932 RepID=G0QRQ2_ICHMU|nr:hypothetical protein IMG5_096850 [Ichthyophthirius multifiliis]EGR32103.1 hypothetical protein IMG5_096850 [Ichthyophthirius multifiliis]|eukprot:XP_004035589.1 hypothetical protein IMG5_096850 [Ichthyophthirius multifiliis]